jgi:tRNA-dihydrouridine synthase 1
MAEAASNGAMATTATPNGSTRKKLTGRAFYESIGSPKVILAPMVDQSEFVRPLRIHTLLHED